MAQTAINDYVKIPKQEYCLLKEVYRTVKRQAFLVHNICPEGIEKGANTL